VTSPVASILERFDREMRRDPPPVEGKRIERSGDVVRSVGSYNTICAWPNDGDHIERCVAEQAAHFHGLGQAVEWKVYGHDGPPDIEAVLGAHGFEPEERETFMLLDLRTETCDIAAPPGIDVRRVRTPEELETYLAVALRAFGSPAKSDAGRLGRRAFGSAPELAIFVAYADGVPAAGARLEMPRGRSFASMWGGGTDPAYRHRGLFRALVAARAAMARSAGCAFLTVDARETSRPILERLGFVAATGVTAWVLPAAGQRTEGPAIPSA
jgi:GNAT superfamily N-acetyltransferase